MADAPKADDFMLPAKDESDDVKFLPPARPGNKIEPLIDGAVIFPALEEAIADAEETVYCTFWSIYTEAKDAPLLSTKVKTALKVDDWKGLLVKVAKDHDVKVRILLTDFDPILFDKHHRNRAWHAFNAFVRSATKAGLTKDQFQVMVSRHPASYMLASGLASKDYLVKAAYMLASRQTKDRLVKVIAGLNKAKLAGLENSPGLWGHVKFKRKKLTMVDSPSLDIFPASHHQKALVIDNKIGFLGGLNISSYFQDTPAHSKAAPAHDIFCRIEGPVVKDLERNFVGRWNAETAGFNAFVTDANAKGKTLGKYKIDHRFPISPLSLSKAVLGKQGNAVAQIHRTLSSGVTGLPFSSVQVVRDDIAKAYERAISQANEFIYLENQVLRHVPLADWIINRFKTNKKLQVIVVLPVLPEEIAEGNADQITKHGQALQHEALTKLMTGLGKNLGVYSLLQNDKAPRGKLAFLGSVQIDVHCKIMVVDDLFASIGTANASGRSFELDTEINVGWYEPDSAKKFREDLWKEHLGSASGSLFAAWKVADYVKEWDAIAGKNAKAKPRLRQGFVVPHDPNRDKGTKMPVLPDFLADASPPDGVDTPGTGIA